MSMGTRHLAWLLMGALVACNGASDDESTDDTDLGGDTDTVDTDGSTIPEEALRGRYEIEEIRTADGVFPISAKYLAFDGTIEFAVMSATERGFRSTGRASALVTERQLVIDREWETEIYAYELSAAGKLTLTSPRQRIVARRKSGAPSPEEWIPAAEPDGEYAITTQSGSDLAWDGTGLWMSDAYGSNQLVRFDFGSGTVTETLPVSVSAIGLAWDGLNVWASSNGHDRIHKLDMTTGASTFSSPSMGAWINGVAWDGDGFWCASHNERTLYFFDVDANMVTRTIPLGEEGLVETPQGLAFVDGALYMVAGSFVHRASVDDDLEVTASWELPGRYVTGITHDGTSFYLHSSVEGGGVFLTRVALP